MNDDQKKHLLRVLSGFNYRATKKYKAGAQEHGGELIQKDPMWVLDQAIDEAVDQFVYLMTLKEQLTVNEPIDPVISPDLSLNEA